MVQHVILIIKMNLNGTYEIVMKQKKNSTACLIEMLRIMPKKKFLPRFSHFFSFISCKFHFKYYYTNSMSMKSQFLNE